MSGRLAKEWREVQRAGHHRAPIAAAATATSSSSSSAVSNSSSSSASTYPDIILHPLDESNLYTWIATLVGPADTPYTGYTFDVKLRIPKAYPHESPSAYFVTPILHPNIHATTGEVCIDTLKDGWSPVWSIESVCRAILLLMAAPAIDSPLNVDAANLLKHNDILGYHTLARGCVLEHAKALPDFAR